MDLGASGAHYTLDSISPKLDHLRSMWTFILYLCFILLGKPNIYVVYKPVVDTKNNRLQLDPNYHLRRLQVDQPPHLRCESCDEGYVQGSIWVRLGSQFGFDLVIQVLRRARRVPASDSTSLAIVGFSS